MASIALVSGSDSNYYPLLREWIHSVRRFDQSASMDLCILDGGMTRDQLAELKPLVTKIISPDWPDGIPQKKRTGMDRLKTCVCRPFIRDVFPGYDFYMWMDADAWVQDWSAVAMFLGAAERKPNRLIITNGADRAYTKPVRVKWLWRWPYSVKNFYFSNGKRAFGFSFAKKLCSEYVMNAGCFALSAQAPHWDVWQKNVVEAARKGRLFPAEQLSLGKTIYWDGLEAEFLPSYTHWICEHRPLWDEARNLFVEPFTPHEPLGVLHLCGVDAMRASKSATEVLKTPDGSTVTKNLRYPFYDGGDLNQAKAARG